MSKCYCLRIYGVIKTYLAGWSRVTIFSELKKRTLNTRKLCCCCVAKMTVRLLWKLGRPSKIRPTVSSRQNIPAV